MKHFMLKFNHGVEIGAYRAYLGHFKRTKDINIEKIMIDEINHKIFIEDHLLELGHDTNDIIDMLFVIIGNIIGILCKFFPICSLNYIANIMEIFASFNYNKIAELYPNKAEEYRKMAICEQTHCDYFNKKK